MLIVTGASGFVGQHLMARLRSLSPATTDAIEVLPIYRSSPIKGGVCLDLADADEVQSIFEEREISAVIHLAAEARPGVCEAEPAVAHVGNVNATRNLLHACSRQKPYFIYVSTDMVFKGDRGDPYSETDKPDPVNVYGRSKVEAEGLVKGYNGPWCIVRPALVYGAAIGVKTSFLSWMIQTLKKGDGSFFIDEMRTPVYVSDLVNLFIQLVRDRRQGLVHAGGLECLSRVQFAELAADAWGIRRDKIQVTNLDSDPSNQWRPRCVCLASSAAHQLVKFHSSMAALEEIRSADCL